MVKFLPYIFGVLALVFGVFFLIYGVRGGFVKKKIMSAYPSIYVTGKNAETRGVLYIAIGILFLVGFLILVFSLINRPL